MSKLKELIGQGLSGFRIAEMTEVYSVDEDGQYNHSVGFFRDSALAEAYAEIQVDAAFHKTRQVVVLTDYDKTAFVFDSEVPVKLFDEGVVKSELSRKVLDTLSPAKRRLIGVT
jgi:hypothetical protein